RAAARNWTTSARSPASRPTADASEQGRDRGPRLLAEIGALQGESDIGAQQADLVAAVIGLAVVFHGGEGLVLHQPGHAVSQLDLAARAPLGLLQDVEDLRLQDVAARDRQVRRRLAARRLLDHALHADAAAVAALRVDDAVLVRLVVRHLLDADDVAPDLRVDVGQLLQRPRLAVDDDVRQD